MTPCIGGGCRSEAAHYFTKLTPELGQGRDDMRELAQGMAKKLQERLGSRGSAKATNISGSSWEVSAIASCDQNSDECGKQKLVQIGCNDKEVSCCPGCTVFKR